MSAPLTRAQVEQMPAICSGCNLVAIMGDKQIESILHTDAALRQQLVTARQEVWEDMRHAVTNGKFIPLNTSFVTAEMFQTIHWLESYIDEQAKAGMKEGG